LIIAIGSKSKMKESAVEKILKQFIKSNIKIVSYPAKSLMSETPFGIETKKGAQNRAKETKIKIKGADYYIGLESGLVKRYGDLYEEAWCCLIDKNNKIFYGYSSGLKIPKFILDKMKQLNKPHYNVMTIIEKSYKIKRGDTWGTYSGFLISRKVSLEEALRNALIQAFADEKSFYTRNIK
jgi:non-canonical (house-cleaning) NTP pyrophosphatase